MSEHLNMHIGIAGQLMQRVHCLLYAKLCALQHLALAARSALYRFHSLQVATPLVIGLA